MSTRIPVLNPDLRLRKREPVAYHSRRSEMHKLNESAYRILGLVDGSRSVREIASVVLDGDGTEIDGVVTKIEAFLERCSSADMIAWKVA